MMQKRLLPLLLCLCLVLCFTACQSSGAAKKATFDPPFSGMTWGMEPDDALDWLGKAGLSSDLPELVPTGTNSSQIVLTPEQCAAMKFTKFANIPVGTLYSPVTFFFTPDPAGTLHLHIIYIDVQTESKEAAAEKITGVYGEPSDINPNCWLASGKAENAAAEPFIGFFGNVSDGELTVVLNADGYVRAQFD